MSAVRSTTLRIGTQARNDPVPIPMAGGQPVDRTTGQAMQVASIPYPTTMMQPPAIIDKRGADAKGKRKRNGSACLYCQKTHRERRPGRANQTGHEVHWPHLKWREGAIKGPQSIKGINRTWALSSLMNNSCGSSLVWHQVQLMLGRAPKQSGGRHC
ncbi:hypothetical protein R1flu_021244 [Riccia fluitans]|uniref:Uncharacterized protein n=1 Tax=Riccia fluitans TaxID=41844 RepID=A0ABD1ZNU3_9MARC